MVKINELNTNKIKKTGNSKLYKNFLKLLMSAGLLSTALTGCAPEEQITDPVVVEPADPVEEKTELEILAEEYEFLQWYLDDSTSKTVDGVTYDLLSLKQQYGDLYRFVEPLSKEEVEYRFQYLAEFFAAQVEKGIDITNAGGVKTDFDEKLDFRISEQRYKYYSEIIGTNNPELAKFSKYYYYLEKTGKYYRETPESFKINGEYYPENLIKVIDNISIEEKEWFVKDYMFRTDLSINIYETNGVEPQFDISLSSKTK